MTPLIEPIVLSMGPIQQRIYDYIERIVIDDFNRDTSEFSSKLQQAKLIRLMQAATNPALLNKAIEDFFYDGPEIGSFVDDEEILELISSYRGNEIPEKFIFLKYY